MRKIVGIDRKIKRAWVDTVLDQLTLTTDEAELRSFLDKHLKDELPGKESRAKTTGILLRIWSGIPPERDALRDRALAMLPCITGQERIWLHWGMTALAYPFFRDTAEVVGRLLALQDDFTTAQVQGRMLTTWGDRVTSKEAAQKLLNTLVDWEVLRSTNSKGHFLLARKMTASIPDLQLWLLEALLQASTSDEIEAHQLLRLPDSFPFTLNVGVADLRNYAGFNMHRQGLDMDMVALRKVKLNPVFKISKKPEKGKKKSMPDGPSLFDMETDENVIDNAKTDTVSAVTLMIPTEEANRDYIDEQHRIEESIKSDVLRTLTDRAARFLQLHGMVRVPHGPFAASSVECAKQFCDGYYFGCIALAHAMFEAVIRHVWQIKLKKNPNQEGSLNKNLEDLHKKQFISDDWKAKLDQMWDDRNAYHHLRPSVDSEQQKLEEKALNTLKLLCELEEEFFGFVEQDGMDVTDYSC